MFFSFNSFFENQIELLKMDQEEDKAQQINFY